MQDFNDKTTCATRATLCRTPLCCMVHVLQVTVSLLVPYNMRLEDCFDRGYGQALYGKRDIKLAESMVKMWQACTPHRTCLLMFSGAAGTTLSSLFTGEHSGGMFWPFTFEREHIVIFIPQKVVGTVIPQTDELGRVVHAALKGCIYLPRMINWRRLVVFKTRRFMFCRGIRLLRAIVLMLRIGYEARAPCRVNGKYLSELEVSAVRVLANC